MLWGPNLRFTWSSGVFSMDFHYSQQKASDFKISLCQTEHVDERSFVEG